MQQVELRQTTNIPAAEKLSTKPDHIESVALLAADIHRYFIHLENGSMPAQTLQEERLAVDKNVREVLHQYIDQRREEVIKSEPKARMIKFFQDPNPTLPREERQIYALGRIVNQVSLFALPMKDASKSNPFDPKIFKVISQPQNVGVLSYLDAAMYLLAQEYAVKLTPINNVRK